MAFAQLTYRESLRDIETCLGAVGGKLYHMGFHTSVARSTLADANESATGASTPTSSNIDWTARTCMPRPLGVDLDQSYMRWTDDYQSMPGTVSVGRFRRRKAAVKMHTLLDLRGNIRVRFTSPMAKCTT